MSVFVSILSLSGTKEPESKRKACDPRIIGTKRALHKVVIFLGSMTEGSYEEFLEKAQVYGLRNPVLVLDTSFRDQGKLGVGVPRNITPDPVIWQAFINDPCNFYRCIPDVYLIDGDIYEVRD